MGIMISPYYRLEKEYKFTCEDWNPGRETSIKSKQAYNRNIHDVQTIFASTCCPNNL